MSLQLASFKRMTKNNKYCNFRCLFCPPTLVGSISHCSCLYIHLTQIMCIQLHSKFKKRIHLRNMKSYMYPVAICDRGPLFTPLPSCGVIGDQWTCSVQFAFDFFPLFNFVHSTEIS